MQVTIKLATREGAAHVSGILAGFTLLAKRGELTLRVQDVRQGNPLAREAHGSFLGEFDERFLFPPETVRCRM